MVEGLLRGAVLLLDVALVFDGLALEIFLRHGAALAVIEDEQILAGATQHPLQLVREIEGVVEAEVHAHAAQGIVDVGGVSGHQKAAIAIA